MNEPSTDNEAEDESDADSERVPTPRPNIFAWCPNADRMDVFLAAVSALTGNSKHFEVTDIDNEQDGAAKLSVNLADARPLLRRKYAKYNGAGAYFNFEAPSGRALELGVSVQADGREPSQFSPIGIVHWYWGFLFPSEVALPRNSGAYPMGVAAALAWRIACIDIHELLVRLGTCSVAIPFAGCAWTRELGPPVRMGATYHADGNPVRDLVMSWANLLDFEAPEGSINLSIDAMRARVEASPPGSSVCAIDAERLTREQVLAALALPPKQLVDALSAAANKPDTQWNAIEAEFLQVLGEIKGASADELETSPITEEHNRFIKDHTPTSVEHLENGAVVLFAHPYRMLWPLWADALRLLGIRP